MGDDPSRSGIESSSDFETFTSMSVFSFFQKFGKHKDGQDEEDAAQVVQDGSGNDVSACNDNIIEDRENAEAEAETGAVDNAGVRPPEAEPTNERQAEKCTEEMRWPLVESSKNPGPEGVESNPPEAEEMVTQDRSDNLDVSSCNDAIEDEENMESGADTSGVEEDAVASGPEAAPSDDRSSRFTFEQPFEEPRLRTHSQLSSERMPLKARLEKANEPPSVVLRSRKIPGSQNSRPQTRARNPYERAPLVDRMQNSTTASQSVSIKKPVSRKKPVSEMAKPNTPETQQLVDEMNQTFIEIEKLRKGGLEEDYAVPELRENLNQFKKLRSQFYRVSKTVSSSFVARKEVERIHHQMVVLCGDNPDLRGPLKCFKKLYTACMKLNKGAK